jgi:hypothetical protein
MLQEASSMTEPSLAHGTANAASSSSRQGSGLTTAAQPGGEDTIKTHNSKPRGRSSSICASAVAEGEVPKPRGSEPSISSIHITVTDPARSSSNAKRKAKERLMAEYIQEQRDLSDPGASSALRALLHLDL